jgi:hypothetical protein
MTKICATFVSLLDSYLLYVNVYLVEMFIRWLINN